MAEKKESLAEKLDRMFDALLTESQAGDTALETKVDIFKEGIRWAAVRNKIPETEGPDSGRLGQIKSKLGK